MISYKTNNPITFINKIEFLDNVSKVYPIEWDSFFDGTTFTILVNSND